VNDERESDAGSEAESTIVDRDAESDDYVTWSVKRTCVFHGEAESDAYVKETWNVKKICYC